MLDIYPIFVELIHPDLILIVFFAEGIELLGYQRYGTVQGPRIGKERINGSILKDNDPFV